MARGIARAPSQNAYRGTLGRTQQTTLHVTDAAGNLVAVPVVITIDAVSDPDLVDRLHGDTLNVVGETRLAVPVLYHDPAAELMVLVLNEGLRHREIDERIAVLEGLRADPAPVPAYAKDFAVVFGGAGLRQYLEHRANQALQQARGASRDSDRKIAGLGAREADLDKRAKDLERRERELLDRQRAELASRKAQREESQEMTVIGAPPTHEPERREDSATTKPVSKGDFDDIETALQGALGEAASAPAGPSPTEDPPPIIPDGADPLTTETHDEPIGTGGDAWLDDATARLESSFQTDKGTTRLVLISGEKIARGLNGQLDLRVLLHRTQHYPVVTLVIGPPPALRVPSLPQLAIVTLDIGSDRDRAVIAALAKKFEIVVELVTRARRFRRVKLVAPLAENVGYIMRAAEDHLRGVASEGEPSFDRARDLVLGAGYDLLGVEHPDAGEFRDDKLAQLETAQHLRRAIAMARRFARPSREDYLVCTRGFPLPRWRQLRRHVLECAVAWGLWMGPELAQVAVSEGLARSRRDLIVKLDRGFETLRANESAFDIDGDAADDNAKALAEEARALGVELKRGNGAGAIVSDAAPVVSGSIGATPPRGTRGPADKSGNVIDQPKTTDELLAQLDDRTHRLAAAIQLCERGEARAAGPVIAAVNKMSRSEAVRVLGMAVKFGEAAKPPLLEGLASSKAFLRHGCALALSMLRTEDGTQAVIDLLLSEPTEIWREVARAIGQVGPQALMPLASNYGRLGDRALPTAAERVAWAMAHVGVRGGKSAIETMANGQSVVAPVAKKALDFLASAANDHVHERNGANGSQGGRDVTVNRAFSRRFFEALEQGLPDAGAAALGDLDASSQMEMLDENDLIDEDAEEIDESDLIQS